ncbi:hypothetical protein CR105_26460 [Massilia eurypsychrophila]|uniref:Uncharacterized protein n=1 Tax=Massilia eurypsychrophila TaxID=1485217 RepID=A0A2G8T7M5_9BURK|nr:hypothetical protein [Massilia eurypsychrophila]PIL42041.1 hypothetical protein CR105_26460 [Massilia eurypsychrophila]
MNDQMTAAAFNLADFEATDTAWLEVQSKKDDGPLLFNGLPVRIEVRSPGTKEAMNAQHIIDTATTTRTYAAMRGKVSKETVEGNIAQRASKLIAVTTQIENFPVSPKDLYANPKLGYIIDQVAKFHGDWANF